MPQIFDFPYHLRGVRYPETGTRIKFGNSWTFATEPNAPLQRTFILHFTTMFYYLNLDGTIDLVRDPKLNMGKLEAFYKEHLLHLDFIYPHDVEGEIVVKFDKPLEIPKGIAGGRGAIEGFQLELIEQP